MQGQTRFHWADAGVVEADDQILANGQEIVARARKQQLCLETIDVSLLLQEVASCPDEN